MSPSSVVDSVICNKNKDDYQDSIEESGSLYKNEQSNYERNF